MDHTIFSIKKDISKDNLHSYTESTLSKLYYTLKNRLLTIESYRSRKQYVGVLLTTMKDIKKELEERTNH